MLLGRASLQDQLYIWLPSRDLLSDLSNRGVRIALQAIHLLFYAVAIHLFDTVLLYYDRSGVSNEDEMQTPL